MIIDAINIEGLGDNIEEAFVAFEERLRQALSIAQEKDWKINNDMNGNYAGTYAPQKYYVSSVLAFLDEYNLEIDVDDISELEGHAFLQSFDKFSNQINRARTRFKLRKARIDSGQAGTLILIQADFKDEIHKNLDTIRKIVNQNIESQNKKDEIFKKIAALQSEIDRDRTTIDAVFGRAIDLSKVLGEFAENLEPAIQKFERIMTALRNGTDRVPLLPKKERQILLPPKAENKGEMDDEIPF